MNTFTYLQKSIRAQLFGMILIVFSANCSGNYLGHETRQLPPETYSTKALSITPGVTPFIAFIDIKTDNIHALKSINYTIEPKPDTISKPVSATFSKNYLFREKYYSPTSNLLKLPVFCLYSDYTNSVDITLTFNDGSSQELPTVTIPTGVYYGGYSPVYFDNAFQGVAGSSSVYNSPIIHVSRNENDRLGFSFFYVKNFVGTPAIIDTDGNVRWLGTQPEIASGSSTWDKNGFVVGEYGSATSRSGETGPKITRYELDGRISTSTIPDPDYLYFTHNIDPGKRGLLGEFDMLSNAGSTIAEFDPDTGTILHEWDLAKIISDYMNSYGDDASLFVRPSVDWFHINAVAYDPSDNSVIASSRENFLIKIDYSTNQIVWIFGDPAKYWYTFPSLRAKALTLESGGLYPIGQHAVSITPQGYLQVFNDGLPSLTEPSGASSGSWRGYSTVSTYSVDEANRTVTDISEFDNGKSLSSIICSSGYTEPDGSMLVDYSVARTITSPPVSAILGNTARLVGLNPDKQIAFDFEYPTTSCATSFIARVIHLESLTFN